jgi:hypothetical protein
MQKVTPQGIPWVSHKNICAQRIAPEPNGRGFASDRSGVEKRPVEHGSMRWRGVRSADPDAAQTPSERDDRRCDGTSERRIDIGKMGRV